MHYDAWFMTKSKDIVRFKYAVKFNNIYEIYGLKIKKEQFFNNPITSKIRHICKR